ncbi:MAG: hypothetical protein QM762_14820 [Chryseolinea sp.]
MKKYHFVAASVVMVFLSLVAFSDNLITQVDQPSNSDPKFIIHGLFCFAWFVILVVQSGLIWKANYKAHATWGIAGLVAAVGVFITTEYIFIVIYKGWHLMPYIAKCNRVFMPAFAIMVWLGYLNRRNPATHKRLMYVATLYMLGPVLDRAMGHSFFDTLIPMSAEVLWNVTLFSLWGVFFVSLFIYDWSVLNKIHKVTAYGCALYCVTLAIAIYT